MSSGCEKIINVNNKPNSLKMIKLQCLNKPKMMQQFLLIVVFVVCLSSKAQRAFVSADEDGLETTTFGEFSAPMSCLIIVILWLFNWLEKIKEEGGSLNRVSMLCLLTINIYFVLLYATIVQYYAVFSLLKNNDKYNHKNMSLSLISIFLYSITVMVGVNFNFKKYCKFAKACMNNAALNHIAVFTHHIKVIETT